MIRLSTDNLIKVLKSDGAITLSPSQIAQVQSVVFDMACDVISICEENGFLYTLGGGTCLGAVRHQGFIPWDDDFDLNIARKDYPRLMEAIENRFADKYWIFRPEGSLDYGYPRAQIQRKGTRLRALSDTNPDCCGVSLDIFIVENAPDSRILRKLHGTLSMAVGFALSCRRYYRLRDEVGPLLEHGTEVEKSIKFKQKVGHLLAFLPLDKWTRAVDRVHSLCKNDHSEYITIPSGRKHYFKEMYRRDAFYPTSTLTFCGRQCSIPREYDSYLKTMYGESYMQIPDEQERESHLVLEFELGEIENEHRAYNDGR